MLDKKPTASQLAERLLYFLTVILTPNINLFFLYGRNKEQNLSFLHFLILGAVLSAVSLITYLIISKLLLRRRRTVVLLALCWAFFWFFGFFEKILRRVAGITSSSTAAIYLLMLAAAVGFVLYYIRVSRYAVNVIAVMLCALFAFNFVPEASAVYAGAEQRLINEQTGMLPYEIKTEFYIDPDLPRPNIYWLHMDGLMGFSAVERYFGDAQEELQAKLEERGFAVNRNARLEAGYTAIAVPALTSPTFYDSYLAAEFARVAYLTRGSREHSIGTGMTGRGFSYSDIYPKLELPKALSDAGYFNIGNYSYVSPFNDMDIQINGADAAYVEDKRQADTTFQKLSDFKDLVTAAGALAIFKEDIDAYIEKDRPVLNSLPIPQYYESVGKYLTGSDLDGSMSNALRATIYASETKSPLFFYYHNLTAHSDGADTEIGGIDYGQFIGQCFKYDENGNIYRERLDDPNSVKLYYPKHKYALKEMMAQVDTIIEYDPRAVIILQADHGIHCFSPEIVTKQGYSLEDHLNLNLQVFSAVRVPAGYGRLSEPLDPLDITRWLINHFVGGGNYEYLYYTEEAL